MYNYISKPSVKKPHGELDREPWTSPDHPPLAQLPLPPEHLQRAWRGRSVGAQQAVMFEAVMFETVRFETVMLETVMFETAMFETAMF